jgi:two-component system cell cycle response regulator
MSSSTLFRPPVAVLVVDDDQSQRDMVAEMLRSEGFAAMTAPNGEDALIRLRSGLPAKVILLDLCMPVMDGWAFLRVQRNDPALAHIPVVVTTGETCRPFEVEADAIFAKPIDLARLMTCVRGLCAAGRRPFRPQ